jgi:exodeoxyribonuclease-5
MPVNQQHFKESFTKHFSFTPTTDQQKAIHELSEFCCNNKEVFILKGYAGTGKTLIISALSKTLPEYKFKSILLAPTGKAAKVISSYSKKNAQTIHKKIYKKTMNPDGFISFSLGENLHKNTVFIIDEASMITDSISDLSGSSVLNDLFEYVFSGTNCKIIFVGDTAQLPPVGSDFSPALSEKYLTLKLHSEITCVQLTHVMRQNLESGILLNATQLRIQLLTDPFKFPMFELKKDVVKVDNTDLEDLLNSAYSKYGFENVLVITRSNKRANSYNQQIRKRIKWQENNLSSGDLVMAVKNNYFWAEDVEQLDFIANGESLCIDKIKKTKEAYGFKFAEAVISFTDFEEVPQLEVNLLLDTLDSETASLSFEQLKKMGDSIKKELLESGENPGYGFLKKNQFYNALQIKFSYAITCHKAQGGQWDCVFVDLGYFKEDMLNESFYRWLYTAFTRAKEKVYLIGFTNDFFSNRN